MNKKSGIAETLRTSIADLQASELTESDLARVGGGLIRGGGGGFGGGGGGQFEGGKCWQASGSIVNPGDTDTAQDYVND